MDISFFCTKCEQHIIIDESAAGVIVDCPNCATQLKVPQHSTGSNASPDLRTPENKLPNRRIRIVAICSLVVVVIIFGIAFLTYSNLPSALMQSVSRFSLRFGAEAKQALKTKDSPAVATAKARLYLAKQKSDLDAMFLALKDLQVLGGDSPETGQELAKVEAGLPILQKMRVSQADHNHEEVVKAAGQFLELFPEHPDARKALKESGLIFAYLQDAHSSLAACFGKDSAGHVQLIEFRDQVLGEIPDFENIFYNLDKAERSLTAAKSLDPQFASALELDKLVSDTKNTIGYDVSLVLHDCDQKIAMAYSSLFDSIYSAMESTLGSSTRSPSDVWAQISPRLQEGEIQFNGFFSKMDELSAHLTSFKNEDTSDFIQMVKAYHTRTMQFKSSVFNPSGSMIDYGRVVGERRTAILDLAARMKTSTPNKHALTENITGFAALALKYELFKTPSETKPVLEKYKSLISASSA